MIVVAARFARSQPSHAAVVRSHQIVPSSMACRTHGITSSSIVLERGRRLEPEHPFGLVRARDAPLDVVLERVVADEREAARARP